MQDTQYIAPDSGANKVTSEFPSRADVLVEIRRMVEQSAARTRLDKGAISDLLTAVDEAAANAIRHGSVDDSTGAILRITCIDSPEFVEVRVRDFGTGFYVPDSPVMPDPDAMGGRGLPLMIALADSVAIESTAHGTTVTLIKRIAE